MKRWVGFSLAAFLAMAVAVPVFGADRGPLRGRGFDGPPGGGRFLRLLESERVKTDLGLTDQQSERLRQILVEAQKARLRTLSDLGVRRIELREMLRAEQPDRSAVLKKVQEISDLRAQAMRQNIETLLTAREVLTPEQRQKVRSYIEQGRAGRGWRGERRPFGPRGSGRRAGPWGNPPHPPEMPQE
jgi:Spy/CpxP family protein refolding chaperone